MRYYAVSVLESGEGVCTECRPFPAQHSMSMVGLIHGLTDVSLVFERFCHSWPGAFAHAESKADEVLVTSF